jgi:hypothetical protein
VGTEIELKVGPLMLDWSKNGRGRDHGVLFREQDRTHIRPAPTDDEGDYIESEEEQRALVRSLISTVPRLELLGFTIETAKAEYEVRLAEWVEYQEYAAEEGQDDTPPLPFWEFIEFLRRHPLNELDTTYTLKFDHEETERIERRFTSDPVFNRIPNTEHGHSASEASYFGYLISIFHPYSLLRLLALVPGNSNLDITWHYGPLVSNGWAQEDEFASCARREQKFMIATEGSSDIHILKRGISLLIPEVEDFFTFFDTNERHPFSGTPSLAKFAEGLVRIDVQNQILFLFDLPSNMRTTMLPELDEFRQFATFGPQGTGNGDINARAAAIECYLDLRLQGYPPPRVLWTNYKDKQKVYQGSLEHKESYTKEFLKQTQETLSAGNYNVAKLQIVLDHIVCECVEIGVQRQSAGSFSSSLT